LAIFFFRLADKLLAIGLERIQFSVFIGPLTDIQYQKLTPEIEKLLGEAPKSNFMLFPLTPTNVEGSYHWGSYHWGSYHWGDTPPDWEYLSGQKLTLIF
jgi:CRISPR/Cas system-associated endoribonuclease Cas2